MDVKAVFQTLAKKNKKAKQTLSRKPEPESVTDTEGSVNDYQEMMKTNMTANYAVVLDLIERTLGGNNRTHALDLCCGPGHLSICLKKFLAYESVTGFDLSPRMIAAAQGNATRERVAYGMTFSQRDVSKPNLTNGRLFDLVLMANAAHHLPTLEHVRRVLHEAEKSVTAEGVIFVTDLARLKNEEITRNFVSLAGAEYGDHMRQDFLNSMHAAWLPSELASSIPSTSDRTWFSLTMKDLPFFQALVGIPAERNVLFTGKGRNWLQSGIFPNTGAEQAFLFMTDCLYGGTVELVQDGRKHGKRVS
jgi:SAM-dependent methyltransferase